MSKFRAGDSRGAGLSIPFVATGLSILALATVGCSSHAERSFTTGPGSGGCSSCSEDAGPPGFFFGDASSVSPSPFQSSSSSVAPVFGATVTASVPPPPISGGTLLLANDGAHAVVSDPDRDSVYVVDLHAQAVAFTIGLQAGDEPGRLVQDGAGRVHVALRGSGVLVTIDPASGSILSRRSVCPAPRGVAWDQVTDLVWVACATGELVALPSAGGAATTSLTVERDLRDVIVSNGALTVSEFRSAQVLRVANDGTITRRDALPSPTTGFVPHVAWRAIAGPSGTVVALHQAESTTSLVTTVQGGYGGCGGGGFGGFSAPGLSVDGGTGDGSVPEGEAGVFTGCPLHPASIGFLGGGGGFPGGGGLVTLTPPPPLVPAPPPPPPPGPGGPGGFGGFSGGIGGCGPESGAVLGVLSVLAADGSLVFNAAIPAVLPVDVAVSPDGLSYAVVAPGNAFQTSAPLNTILTFDRCGNSGPGQMVGKDGVSQQPIAVAFDTAGNLLVQTREPAALWILGSTSDVTIPLSSQTRADTGFDVFHTQAGAMIACASCHPEGRDDGHVWLLDDKQRRTPSLHGTIAGTAPYHWPGDEPSLNVLVNDVYTVRMNGAPLDDSQMGAVTTWVKNVGPLPAPTWVDPSASLRGKALFERADVGCATCHSGPKFTNNLTMDVGTGGLFQVPPLVGVGWRTPLMHDGCAATLTDRFGACATPQHGSTGALSKQDVSDLVSYLETL
jgi:hypothetical protein